MTLIQRYGGCSERHHSHHIKRDGCGIITNYFTRGYVHEYLHMQDKEPTLQIKQTNKQRVKVLNNFNYPCENIQRYGGCSERHHSHHIKRDGRGIITKLQPGHPKEREKNLTNDTSGSVNSSSPACTPVRRYVISENKISNCKCIRSSRHIITSCYMPHHDTS